MKVQKSAVRLKNLSKTFQLPHERHASIKGALLNFYRKNRSYEKQKVLEDISFEIQQGDFFGIVGRNGSGKSTLLKLLAGIYIPDTGKIEIDGTLTPFIELGVGFNPELTGRENVFLNGALLGFDHADMESMYDDIVSFAELERFMDQKLKNYSSGMQVRLAFSIAIRADTDILLLDEVLAVGDALFQKKCYDYFKELKRRQKTVVLVSHDSGVLQEYCNQGILLEKGKIVSRGRIDRVVKDYIDILNEQEEKQGIDIGDSPEKQRWGTGEIQVIDTAVIDSKSGKPRVVFTGNDLNIRIAVRYRAKATYEGPVYGITIMDGLGHKVLDSNTMWSKIKSGTIKHGETITVTWDLPNVFNTGRFTIAPAVADRNGSIIYDWWDDAAAFKVRKQQPSTALTNVKHKITLIRPTKDKI